MTRWWRIFVEKGTISTETWFSSLNCGCYGRVLANQNEEEPDNVCTSIALAIKTEWSVLPDKAVFIERHKCYVDKAVHKRPSGIRSLHIPWGPHCERMPHLALVLDKSSSDYPSSASTQYIIAFHGICTDYTMIAQIAFPFARHVLLCPASKSTDLLDRLILHWLYL